MLADTGAGKADAPFELLLDEQDCVLCGAKAVHAVNLGGAYSGSFPCYSLRVDIPSLGFSEKVFVVGIPTPPKMLDGIAGFRFLNRFMYGNFGDTAGFGLEC